MKIPRDVCKDCAEYGSNFCEQCLKEMIDKEKIINTLKESICIITFTKNNGEERVMSCTLNEEFLPEIVKEIEEKAPREKNPDVLAVWDTDKGAWRSFRWDSLKEFKREIKL